MKYELLKLDNIVMDLMSPGNLARQKNKAAMLETWLADALAEKKRIQQQFLQEFYNYKSEDRIAYFIQQHQLALIKLSDRLFQYLQQGTTGNIFGYPLLKAYTGFYNIMLDHVEQLLLFIVNHFSRYYNPNFKIQDKILAENKQVIKTLFKKSSSTLKRHAIDETIVKIICTPFEICITDKPTISYSHFEYINHYQNELNLFLDHAFISNDDACNFLIRMNQNSHAYFNYYIHTLKRNAENDQGTNTMIEYYAFRLKLINQFPTKLVCCYEPTLPGIREQICNWLIEEIYFLEKKQQLEHSFEIRTQETHGSSNKVQTRLTVGHLSLAVKLLLDTGVIKTKNMTDLIRMVARNFRTEKSEHISEDSLRNKVYNIEPVAVSGMKDLIVELLNEVRKY